MMPRFATHATLVFATTLLVPKDVFHVKNGQALRGELSATILQYWLLLITLLTRHRRPSVSVVPNPAQIRILPFPVLSGLKIVVTPLPRTASLAAIALRLVSLRELALFQPQRIIQTLRQEVLSQPLQTCLFWITRA